jgi:Fur family zinc uptake transcriptional regulator
MKKADSPLSAHSKKILALLTKSTKPLTAYDILDRLHSAGIKAPPTVYRALETLTERGLVHRIESLGAFVACHHHEEDHAAGTQFAVCKSCGKVMEILDRRLMAVIRDIGKHMKFRIEREMLEVLGVCNQCDKKAA